MLEAWTSFTEQTGSNSFVMSTIKDDHRSLSPGCPLPDIQDNGKCKANSFLSAINASYQDPVEWPLALTRKRTESFSRDDVC